MNNPSESQIQAAKETGRLEAFSDGVFAIAITLLVLELKVPHLSGVGAGISSGALGRELAMQWPSYLAFVTSFFTVLIMWVHHHAMLRLVRATDARLLFSNGFLLFGVTIVPFPTAVVAQYLVTPAAKIAGAVYGGTFVMIALGFQLLLNAALRRHLLVPGASEAVVLRLRKGYRLGPLLYLVATVSTMWSVWLCIGICTALWIFWAAMTVHIARPE